VSSPNALADRFGPILGVAALAFKESSRHRVLHALVFATLLACGASYLIAYVSGGDYDVLRQRKVVLDLSLSAITLIGTMAVIFLGTNLIYQEIERRTIYAVLARPLSRGGFVLGKYLGLAAVMGVALLFMGGGFLVLFVIGGGSPSLGLFAALGFIYLEFLVVLAVALLLSVAAHPIEGAVMAFVVAVVGHITQSLNDLGGELTRATANFEPTIFHHALKHALYVLYVLFPNLENFNLKAEATYGIPLDPSRLGWSVAYAVVYVSILLVLSAVVFRRRAL
jgi:ABC-type transport system involved in multi-copper enzyme maturation permease subunit